MTSKVLCLFSLLGVLLSLSLNPIFAQIQDQDASPTPQIKAPSRFTEYDFIEILQNDDPIVFETLLQKLDQYWSPELIPKILETLSLSRSGYVHAGLSKILRYKTGQNFRDNNSWYKWLWNQAENIDDDYGNFKAALYVFIDPRFETYFKDRQNSAQIRLDEIRWGGVVQDGIPPLRNPKMIEGKDADYLDDDNIIFGVEIDGDTRAYPKRILAWHEMFIDDFGKGDKKQAIAGVYCTLCGTLIIYKTRHKGVDHQIGTSGFLYRSNKLMYDQATQSMWSTVRGEPVLGPLVGKGIALEHLSVVTTTWKEWKRRHPETIVLSLETGHRRDYAEGVAYKEYFSNDKLMFATPFDDTRLANKREILALRFAASPDKQLAIDTEYLIKNPVFSDRIGQQKFVVLTDKTGANRVYNPGSVDIISYDGLDTAIDSEGTSWLVTEQSLNSKDNEKLGRLPYHRAFWFGWHAAFPDTKLIQ